MQSGTCAIWNLGCRVTAYDDVGIYIFEDSFRAGGDYQVDEFTADQVRLLGNSEKARLTSWLTEQRLQANEQPLITMREVGLAKSRPSLPVHERAERLLRCLAQHSTEIGECLDIVPPPTSPNIGEGQRLDSSMYKIYLTLLAWSESTSLEEVNYLIAYLEELGWVTAGREIRTRGAVYYTDAVPLGYLCRVEVDGYRRMEALTTNPESSRCFVAMWFDDSLDEAYRFGIEPAIAASGYDAIRIDKREDLIGEIDDAIIAEIRRSRFLVADFTHGDDGARGGVYYEAGFARGLDTPVIFLCREDKIGEVHFDTRQFNHIVWKTHDDLQKQLTNRILAAIGEGPNVSTRK